MENTKKTFWLSLETNNLLRETIKDFFKFLNKYNIIYTSYSSKKRIYIEVTPNETLSESFDTHLNQWIYFNAISVLQQKPKISELEILQHLSFNYDC